MRPKSRRKYDGYFKGNVVLFSPEPDCLTVFLLTLIVTNEGYILPMIWKSPVHQEQEWYNLKNVT